MDNDSASRREPRISFVHPGLSTHEEIDDIVVAKICGSEHYQVKEAKFDFDEQTTGVRKVAEWTIDGHQKRGCIHT